MKTFDRLFVLGRPASGKSEFLAFMRSLSAETRANEFHIGSMQELDDFPWLWEKFEEDDLWEELIGKRFHSEKLSQGYMNTPEIFDFTMKRFDRDIAKHHPLSNETFYRDHTLLIEFARGGERPYGPAFKLLRPETFQCAAILYIEVSGAESRRRNEARYQEKMKHSILAHKVPDEVMDRYYVDDDWMHLTQKAREGSLTLQGVKVPFVTMNNEPELTDTAALRARYGTALSQLWELAATT